MATVATISVNFAQYNATSFNAPGVIDRSINPSTLSQYCLGSSTPDFNYLGGFVKKTADTMSGYLTLPSTNPTLDDHATRKGYVDSRINSLSSTVSDSGNGFVKVQGSTMTGALILNTSSPTLPLQSSSKGYVDARVSSLSSTVDSKLAGEFLAKAGGTMSGIINMGSNKIQSLAAPVLATDAATKQYVDSAVGTGTAGVASIAYVNAQDALNVLKTGSTMTGQLTIAGSDGIIGVNTGGIGAFIDVRSDGTGATTNAAYMTFHRPGVHAVKMGLDTDNVMKIGGWSMGNVAHTIVTSGNITTFAPTFASVTAAQTTANSALAGLNNKYDKTGGAISGNVTVTGTIVAGGDITAFSDERLKHNINRIENALDKTLQLNGVTFETKENKKSLGVIAQNVLNVLPEVVQENDNGYLSVAYGNIVGVLIEAIKELNAKIEKLEAKN